jgi:hypothetical protein
MNNVSEKNEIIRWFVLGMLAFAVWIILMIIQPGGISVFFMFFLPIIFLGSLLMSISGLSYTDIIIDEPKNMLIITTLFTKREIRLEDFKIEGHANERNWFRVYTNSKDIVMSMDVKSYDTLTKLFELKNYKGSKSFNAELMRSISIWGLDFLSDATFETYEKIKMRAGMNDIK